MKVKKIVSQNIIIFPKINQIKDLPNSSLKYVHLCTQYLVRGTFSTNDSISESKILLFHDINFF